MRRNTQKLLKGVCESIYTKEKHQARGSVCMRKPAEETKVPRSKPNEKNGSLSKRSDINGIIMRDGCTRSVKSERVALMKKTTNRSIGRTSLRKEQEALWEREDGL
ncbi:hypothetical protein QQF64_002996 [Cirrhinus molitorella]|uniref:Uncharacterized protein n=1 Tax=Cirrhinus molitorella TaxID=172907 RepID=A0ABR3MKN5_9TELE